MLELESADAALNSRQIVGGALSNDHMAGVACNRQRFPGFVDLTAAVAPEAAFVDEMAQVVDP